MLPPQNELHTSDTEGSERPLRERLRKTSIAARGPSTRADAGHSETVAAASSKPEKPRGRPQKKRSHENVGDEDDEPAHKSRHGRKRSRESTQEDPDQDQPGKRKSGESERSNHLTITNGTDEPASLATERPASPAVTEKPKAKESPKTKRNKVDDDANPAIESTENDSTTTKIPAGSGFANTSAASPFATLAQSKSPSEQPQTSTGAFAASGFGALATSSASGFGALGQTKTMSSFASPSPSATPAPADENSKPETKSAFGGTSMGASPFAAAGPSAFGSGTSGFGKLGNGFGGGFGGLGGLGGLSSFASSGTPGVIGSTKPSKPFGAPAEEEGENAGDEEGEESGIKSPKPAEEEDKDDRFFRQDIETGEENESTEYTCRAKLYNFVDKKEWKERGLGVLRLNVLSPQPGDDSTAPKARLLMRADGSHRVILNTPIQKGIKFGTVTGEPPVGGYMYFMGSMDGQPKLQLLQLKIRQQFALELYDHIADWQKQM